MPAITPGSGRTRPRCLVVYESMFDNTADVAWAVAEGLGDGFDVERTDVRSAPTRLLDVALLVVGAPTHRFGLSRPGSRATAGAKGAERPAAEGIGVREWLGRIERTEPGLVAVAFETRLRRPRLPGSAVRAVRRRLRRLGCVVAEDRMTFLVSGMTGPLIEGQPQRAVCWGRALAARFGPPAERLAARSGS